MRYIFVSGGVVSGLGKGVISASVGMLLKLAGFRVCNVKVDMYLNIDAGTIRPQEHGEVFVTSDGLETDQDIGNYERFLGQSLKRVNYLTTGQVYKAVIDRERSFGYHGEDVEAIPHVTDEIIRRLKLAGESNNSDIVIIELGGTVGEYQNILFFEANRILKLQNSDPVLHLHVSYLPVIKSIGELKSKPAQQSARVLQGMGLQPDLLITRSERPIDEKRKQKLALFCNLKPESVLSCPDIRNIYKVPLILNKQKLVQSLSKKLGLHPMSVTKKLKRWLVATKRSKTKKEIVISLVGKYFKTGDFTLKDSYVSVVEALNQAANLLKIKIKHQFIDSESLKENRHLLQNSHGILIPQGWGSRGVEGKIKAVHFARKNKIPFLGLCFGMQMAVVEFARNVCKLKNANSIEVDPQTPYPVIHIMEKQKQFLKKHQYGGTIRLGSYPCRLKKYTLLKRLYKKYTTTKKSPWLTDTLLKQPGSSKSIIYERHRHRYELNNKYLKKLKHHGLIISGLSPDKKLVEAIEIKGHPFFVGVQYHPEYIARPLTPHPLFLGFVKACLKRSII